MRLGFTGQATLEAAKQDLRRYHKKDKRGVIIQTQWGFVHVIGEVVFSSDDLDKENLEKLNVKFDDGEEGELLKIEEKKMELEKHELVSSETLYQLVKEGKEIRSKARATRKQNMSKMP